MRGSDRSTGRRKRLLTRTIHISALTLSLALAFGPFGSVSAGAVDRSRDGSFSSDTEVISEDPGGGGAGGGASVNSTGTVSTRIEGSSAETPRHEPRHGGASVQVDFQAANPTTYNHAGGGALAGFGWADTTSTLNGGDFACGESVVFLVEVHVGSGYAGAPITGLAYNFAKDTTGQPGAGYTGIGAPSLVQTDAAFDDQGAVASISNVSISNNATHHILSFDLSGVDGALPAPPPDADGDTIIVRFTATLGCVAGQNPTGQIQANQIGVGGNDTVNLGVQGLATPPALTITKTSPSTNVTFNTNITWTITVANTGGSSATNVIVSDPLPAGFVLVSATPSTGSCGNPAVTCNLGTIAAGASATVTIVATAPSTCGPFTNSASGTFGTGQAIPGSPASHSGTVVGCPGPGTPAPVISKVVSGGGPADVTIGGNISWTVTVSNAAGTADATNVIVSDPLPAGFVLVSATPSTGSCGNPAVTCNLGTIAAGASATVTIVATAPSTCGPYTNTATGNFGAAAPVAIPPSGNSVSGDVTGCAAVLSLSKSGPTTVTQGQNITWTVTVTNTGNADASNIVVTDTLPTGFAFVSSSPGAPTCTQAAGVVTCTIASVPKAGGQVSISIEATAPTTCGPFTNTAVSGNLNASVSGNVTGCSGPVPNNPALTIVKSAGSSVVQSGGTVSFSITVTSTGNVDATGVVMTDTLPTIPGTTWSISGGNGAGSCSLGAGNVVTCNYGNMSPGASFTVTLATTATTTASCGTYQNTATADASNTSPVTASASVQVTCPAGNSGVDLTKTGPATAKVGDTIAYSFAATLTPGSPNLSGFTFADPICDPGTIAGPTGDDGDGVLEGGETWGFSCTHVVTTRDPDPLPNTATFCATDPAGATVCDSDDHEVDIAHPAIDVEKEADPTSGSPGDVITFTYTVTNSGDVPLFDVSVDDNVLGHICDIPVLQPHGTVVCTGSYTIPANASGTITNIVIAGGTDPAGDIVEDEDDFTIAVVAGTTVTKTPPGGLAFTGPAAAIPVAALAVLMLTAGTGLLWLGRRRGRGHVEGSQG